MFTSYHRDTRDTYGVQRSLYSFAIVSIPPARATPIKHVWLPTSNPTTDIAISVCLTQNTDLGSYLIHQLELCWLVLGVYTLRLYVNLQYTVMDRLMNANFPEFTHVKNKPPQISCSSGVNPETCIYWINYNCCINKLVIISYTLIRIVK
jgi:hypothetical protein